MTAIIDMLKRWKELAILAGFFLTLGWFAAKPWAQDFIHKTVDSNITQLQDQIAALQLTISDQKLGQARSESDLASLKALLQQLLDLELTRARPGIP